MNLPTKITLVRILLIPIFVALYLINFPGNTIYATVIFAIASLTDWLDGYLARKYNLVTDLGKFLDPIADKVLVSTALILVAVMPVTLQIPIVICSLIIIARELIITCFRTIAATKEVILAADYLGKLKTTTQLIGLIFLLPAPAFVTINTTLGNVIFYIGFVFLIIATLLTIASAINYIYKNFSVLVEDKKSLKKINKKLEEVASKAYILLRNSSYTISIAESFTGGRIASELIKNAGASAVVKEAIVCYDPISKITRLGVEESVIEQYGVVSEQVAVDMSVGLLNTPLKPDFTISTTGNAGPIAENSNIEPIGYVCVSDENFSAPIKIDLDGDRKYNVALGSIKALETLISIIEKDKFGKKID